MTSTNQLLKETNTIRQSIVDFRKIHVKKDDKNPIIRILDKRNPNYKYEDCPAVNSFLEDKHQLKIILGPYGSGKTSAICQRLLWNAVNMPKCKDGVRKYTVALIRNTYGELCSTTFKSWMHWSKGLPLIKKQMRPLWEYQYQFNDEEGKIELNVLFLALDREDDREKLGSLELTDAFINEIQFIPEGIINHLQSRVGRYPSLSDFDNPEFLYDWYIYADTNPPDDEHWIAKKDRELETISSEITKIYHQPPGLIEIEKEGKKQWITNLKADNLKNLRTTYYIEMIEKGLEHLKVFALGFYGLLKRGKLVYPEYNDQLHCVDSLNFDKNLPILIAFDHGLTPAALLSQRKLNGQILIIKEFTTERCGTRAFVRDIVLPWLRANLDGYTIYSIGDPSGEPAANKQRLGLSSHEILKEEGLETFAAKTNAIEPRIEAVRTNLIKLLNTTPAQPAILISQQGCPILRQAIAKYYIYRKMMVIGEEKYKEVPDKSHPWSDIMDDLQYICCEYGGIGIRWTEEKPELSKNYAQER